MTTKRMSFQKKKLQQPSHHHYQLQHQHQHQQQQRRPPDVEEALSSMLWTPYERASTTDTSSDEEDDELLQYQLKKSKSQYDYTSVPTTAPSLTPPPLPVSSMPSIGSANNQFPIPPTHLTPTNIMAFITAAPPARVAAAAVEATSLISTMNAYYTAEDLFDPSVTTPLVPFSNLTLNAQTTATTPTATHSNTAEEDDNEENHDNDVIVNANVTFSDVFNNDNTLAAASSSMTMMSSYQKKNRISYHSSCERIPTLTKWWSNSNATSTHTPATGIIQSNSAAAVRQTSASSSATAPLTDETNKQPPSYESLYKKPTLHPLRHRHRFNKHLNLFKPVFHTLKANVTTIAQGRLATLTRTDHNTLTDTNPITQTANVVTETTLTTTNTAVAATTDDNCRTEGTSNNLVHSFTDNFLHEHCTPLQHVAVTNVDIGHIMNNTNNVNNSSGNSAMAVNINGLTTSKQQQQPAVIHQRQYECAQLQNETNEKANANAKPKQENDNKQNNNFIICQQQQIEQLQTKAEKEMNTTEFTIDQREIEHNRMNPNNKNPPPFNTTTSSTTASSNTTSLFYDSSSAISLTRSFEANTSCSFNIAVAHNNFITDLKDETTATTNSLTPNKCLAELERLYAEFRASESLREQKLRESQNKLQATSTATMRLNVPAPTLSSVDRKATDVNGTNSVSEITRLNPSTSSVFLTTTNSVTALTNSCQRTPSLTIQVNQSNNNNSNINNNNNNPENGQHESNKSQVILKPAIVNTTTTGVSVINCNYINNNNNNHNNNCNYTNNNNINIGTNSSKCITNASDIQSNSNDNCNVNNNHCSTNCHTKLNNIAKNINNNCNGGSNSDHLSTVPNNLVPQVLNITDTNIREVSKNVQNSIKNSSNTEVKVIQVNEGISSSSSTPISSPHRSFTSTECQTDDVGAVQLRSAVPTAQPLTPSTSATATNNNRDQRRRERRERRHLQHTASLLVAPTHSHTHSHIHSMRHGHLDRHSMPAPPLPPILHPPHLHHGLQQSGHNVAMLRPMLPDILHNHFPPPYSALPHSQSLSSGGAVTMPHHNASPIPFSNQHPQPHPHHPPLQTPTPTILGPPPPPPPAGTTLLTSVISTVPIPGATPLVSDGRFTLPLPVIRRTPSERSGKGCCGQWFTGPPLRALIAVVALGGVACALGGAALGATGLAGPPSSHFTAALLMIGVGVVLVTVSGAAWRMTAPGGPPCLGLGSSVDLGRCGRRPCSRGGGAPQGLLYPEFQHRPPPPSYQASMQEYRLRLLLLDRDRQNGVVRGSSPPPTYRSHAGSLLRAPLTSTIRTASGGHRCDSSIGGSEYSFPPSYRSRNTTPGTISSERSIETEPSGRLLANEDIPEPLSVEQLSEYNSLQHRCNNNTISNGQKGEKKKISVQLDTNILIGKSDNNLNNLSSDKKDDLVTIVTITPQNSDNLDVSENRSNGNVEVMEGSESREQIEILAHL